MIDPTDTSKQFGQVLNDLLYSIQEFERDDFKECIYNGNYDDFLTAKDTKVFNEWIEGKASKMTTKLMLKCPHLYAQAVGLMWLMEDEE